MIKLKGLPGSNNSLNSAQSPNVGMAENPGSYRDAGYWRAAVQAVHPSLEGGNM